MYPLFAEIPSAWILLGMVFAVFAPIFVSASVAIYRLAARHKQWRLETAKVSEEEVDVSENHAPRRIQRRPVLFISPVISTPPLVFADDAAGRYHNIVVSLQYPKYPIVFDSYERALPGSRIKVLVKKDSLTGEVLEITSAKASEPAVTVLS